MFPALWPCGRRRGLRLAIRSCPRGRDLTRPLAARSPPTCSALGRTTRGPASLARLCRGRSGRFKAAVAAVSGRRPPPPAAEKGYRDGDPPRPPGSVGSSGVPVSSTSPEAQYHDWHWQSGRWLCVTCLASSRTAVPRRQKCPGFSPAVRRALEKPRGHTLQIATFSNGFGLIVICRKCGHLLSSNRQCKLRTDDCKAKGGQANFASPSARMAYRRVCDGKHPVHAKFGEAKVLDRCMPAPLLLALAQRGGPSPPPGDPT
jgi:hypothetical protein